MTAILAISNGRAQSVMAADTAFNADQRYRCTHKITRLAWGCLVGWTGGAQYPAFVRALERDDADLGPMLDLDVVARMDRIAAAWRAWRADLQPTDDTGNGAMLFVWPGQVWAIDPTGCAYQFASDIDGYYVVAAAGSGAPEARAAAYALLLDEIRRAPNRRPDLASIAHRAVSLACALDPDCSEPVHVEVIE